MRTRRLLTLIVIVGVLVAGIAIVAPRLHGSKNETLGAAASVPASSSEQSQVPKESAPTEPAESPKTQPEQSGWKSDFRSATDLGDFVARATAAADAGDGAAAYYAGEALAHCSLVVAAVRKGRDEESYIASITWRFTPPELTAIQRTQYKRCAPLATRAEFADWSQETGGKMTGTYWLNVAVERGSAVAKAEQITRSAVNLRTAEQIEQLRSYATDVVRSAEPDAIFKLGLSMLNAHIAKDPAYGLALALAACDLGYDCSGKERNNAWSFCDLPQHCGASRSFQQYAQDTFSSGQFSRAYARAEEYKGALARGATDELSPFANLDGLDLSAQRSRRAE